MHRFPFQLRVCVLTQIKILRNIEYAQIGTHILAAL